MSITEKFLNFIQKNNIDPNACSKEELLAQVADILSINTYKSQTNELALLNQASNHPAFQKISINRWKKLSALPIEINEHQADVIITDPFLPELAKELSFILNKEEINLYLADQEKLDFLFKKLERGLSDKDLLMQLDETIVNSAEKNSSDFSHESDVNPEDISAPFIIRLVDKIFADSIDLQTSDIHITPNANGLKVRVRQDGILTNLLDVPKNFKNPVTARIKLLAGMDIAEKRKPQDGRLRLKTSTGNIDLRISSMPSVYGENLVIRLLALKTTGIDLESLGMNAVQLTIFKQRLKDSAKVVLVSGPTGSGKSSTLYAGLKFIADGTKNIITIEDPIEYRLENITQMQVNPKIGLTFAHGLRSALRQDPDVIMVGEIRDLETAQIAMQASQTGHLVLSTIHTNTPQGVITRLLDFGVPSFLIASSLSLIVAQRLVRKLNSDGEFSGRIPIYSFLEITPEISEIIREQASEHQIVQSARLNGFKTLWENAQLLIEQKLTTQAEIERVLGEYQDPGNLPTNKLQEQFSKRKLLLVEDDDSTRAVLTMLFEEQFFEVTSAINGYEALEKLQNFRPSIIVSDLMMPKMSGLDMVKKIKSNSALASIPVLMLTAAHNEENEINLIEHGADDFVPKTADSKVMLARVERLLKNKIGQYPKT